MIDRTIFTPAAFAYINAKRVEKLRSSKNTSTEGDETFMGDELPGRSLERLQKRLHEAKSREQGYSNRLDPRLAVALTAANDRKPVSLPSSTDVAHSYEEANSFTR